jgi:hypothetical protein
VEWERDSISRRQTAACGSRFPRSTTLTSRPARRTATFGIDFPVTFQGTISQSFLD